MSFVWKAAQRLRTPEQVMAVIIQTVDELNMPDKRGAAICAGMCVAQESDFWCPWNAADPESKNYPYDSQSDDGRSVGYYQQQKGPSGELWWGPTSQEMDLKLSTREFLTRLNKVGYNASNAQAANDSVQAVQRSGVPQGYTKHWDRISTLYDSVQSGAVQEPTVGVSGDPVWLEDVLRPALGDRLKTLPGWQTDGVGGTMGNIWGVIWHHTGNAAETPDSISKGRPDLQGPLAQLHIAPDGTVTIVAVGPCNHAGKGSWPGLQTDNANAYTIGIECAWPRDTTLTEETASKERWPDAQIIAMRDTGAALTKYLGVDVSHNISHREWARFGPAGQRQYKWDPGNLDMNWFRGEIQKAMNGEFDQPTTPTPPAVKVWPKDYSDRELLEWIVAQLGAGDPSWPSKGMTLRDKVWSLGKAQS